ncbi:MAG: hypothetical protein ACD_80C00211G0003 [uncultured bacterium (gcode 4)]|uniref:Uncharacterized protein n=1 Tax=uncultured bacterium (gcode 4) TaxID=1234023 RepID=K1XHF9_9BACT|nr:MAG: hypothetical protein ACD_80C00211G0003 [uncultured bacterium (gcode 4)]
MSPENASQEEAEPPRHRPSKKQLKKIPFHESNRKILWKKVLKDSQEIACSMSNSNPAALIYCSYRPILWRKKWVPVGLYTSNNICCNRVYRFASTDVHQPLLLKIKKNYEFTHRKDTGTRLSIMTPQKLLT